MRGNGIYIAYTTDDGREGFVNEGRIVAVEKGKGEATIIVLDSGATVRISETPEEIMKRIAQTGCHFDSCYGDPCE